MTVTQLTEADEGETKLETAIKHVLADEMGILVFRYLCDELGFLRSSIAQNAETKAVLGDVMLGCEANRKVWLKLRQLIPDDKLVQIEIQGRREGVKIVDKAKGRVERWMAEAQQQAHQMQEWDNRILEGL